MSHNLKFFSPQVINMPMFLALCNTVFNDSRLPNFSITLTICVFQN